LLNTVNVLKGVNVANAVKFEWAIRVIKVIVFFLAGKGRASPPGAVVKALQSSHCDGCAGAGGVEHKGF
jgi:hypothetical protein